MGAAGARVRVASQDFPDPPEYVVLGTSLEHHARMGAELPL